MANTYQGDPKGRKKAAARLRAKGFALAHNDGLGDADPALRKGTRPFKDEESGMMFLVFDNGEHQRVKADARVSVNDEAVLEGKTRKKLRKSEQLRAQRRSKRRLRVGGNLSIGTKGDSGVGTGGSKKSSLNIPKG